MKVLDLFAGIGSIVQALKNIGADFEIVAFAEIDKFAIQSYQLLHGNHRNLGDVSLVKEEDIPDCDLISYGFPCQDISVAGKQGGIIQGETRSGLLYEALRIIKAKKPKYAVAENVKNLVGKKFRADFELMLQELDEMGYNNYWQVLNAKDYGVPQNRERVFVVSIRKDIDKGFAFAPKKDNGLRLKDMLEEEVDEKYYFNVPLINRRLHTMQGGLRQSKIIVIGEADVNDLRSKREVYSVEGISRTLLARSDSPKIVAAAQRGREKGQQFEISNRPISNAITTVQKDSLVAYIATQEPQIRKLTPRECWRLMGFTDKEFDKVEPYLSNTQLYKQAGNSIVVPVYESILKELERGE